MQNATKVNLLLSSIALSDFIFILLSTPCNIILAAEIFRILEILLILMSLVFFSAISSITLTPLATLRYNALVNPMKIQRRLSKRFAKIAICVIWQSVLIRVSCEGVRCKTSNTGPGSSRFRTSVQGIHFYLVHSNFCRSYSRHSILLR